MKHILAWLERPVFTSYYLLWPAPLMGLALASEARSTFFAICGWVVFATGLYEIVMTHIDERDTP